MWLSSSNDKKISLGRFWKIFSCILYVGAAYGFTDSPLLQFTFHFYSQADCDDSIQLNSSFSGCSQKRLDSRFQIVLALKSTIQVWLFQSYGKLERIQLNSIHSRDSYAKMLQIHCTSHLPICLISSQPTQQIDCKADSYLMLLALQRVALILNEINKTLSFTCVIVFPLLLRRQLNSFLYVKAVNSVMARFWSYCWAARHDNSTQESNL